jgi:hypothetical protein
MQKLVALIEQQLTQKNRIPLTLDGFLAIKLNVETLEVRLLTILTPLMGNQLIQKL